MTESIFYNYPREKVSIERLREEPLEEGESLRYHPLLGYRIIKKLDLKELPPRQRICYKISHIFFLLVYGLSLSKAARKAWQKLEKEMPEPSLKMQVQLILSKQKDCCLSPEVKTNEYAKLRSLLANPEKISSVPPELLSELHSALQNNGLLKDDIKAFLEKDQPKSLNNSLESKVSINFSLPQDILFYIFSFLSIKDLAKCSRVNSLWNEVAQHNMLWKSEIQQDVKDDFISLVDQDVLTWKEVHRYARLSDFIARSMQYRRCTDNFIQEENPELNSEEYPSVTMPKPFLKYGSYIFSICDSTNIKIHRKGENEPAVLMGEKGKMLIYLVAEGDYLFALRRDGMIIQWDYKKKEEINKIETAYVKKHKSLNKLKDDNFYTHNSFYIKNGTLVIKYGMALINVLEIIPYSNSQNSKLIIDPLITYPHRITLEKGKLFLLNRNDIGILNLSKNKKESLIKVNMDTTHFIFDIAINKDILYAIDSTRELHIINLKTKKESKFRLSLTSEYENILTIEVIDNLLFGFTSQKNQIVVINLDSKTIVKAFPFDFENNETNIINELVKIDS